MAQIVETITGEEGTDTVRTSRPNQTRSIKLTRHKSVSVRWCDASDLRGRIHVQGPDLWVHGRVHHASDYRAGPTRIVCNPRSHADEATGFGPGRITMPRG